MTDEDIYAFHPVPTPRPPAASARRRWWPWLLAALLVVGVLAAAALASALLGVADSAPHGLHVRIDGDDWNGTVIDADGLRASVHDHWGVVLLGLTVALAAVFVVVTVVVPLAVLLGLLAAALGVGVALLALVGVAAVALSPLWLLGLLLWLALRRRRPAA